jgi:hypothetical protein
MKTPLLYEDALLNFERGILRSIKKITIRVGNEIISGYLEKRHVPFTLLVEGIFPCRTIEIDRYL